MSRMSVLRELPDYHQSEQNTEDPAAKFPKSHAADYSAKRPQLVYDGLVKRKAEYLEGQGASSNFERAMRGLFQIPRSETPARPRREKRRKVVNGKLAR